MSKRLKWIDVAKGIGIITVVMGHSNSTFLPHYLFWFHMPLFFIISGYLYNPINLINLRNWSIKVSKKFLIPYISYGLLISILVLIIQKDSIGFVKQIIKLFYGGELLLGYFATFWFITCLLFTQVIFSFINSKFKFSTQILIILILYLLSHLISSLKFIKDFPVPFNFDVVLISICYYSIGFYTKEKINKLITLSSTLIICSVGVLTLCLLDASNIMNYSLDMKYNEYNHYILDLLIPLIFTLFILCISYKLSKTYLTNILEKCGKVSLTIMYLHMPINLLLKDLLSIDYGLILFTLIGIIIPMLINDFIFEKKNFLRYLFLGNLNSSKIRNNNSKISV